MKHPTKLLAILAILAALADPLAGSAQAADPCRQAVVIYLDVSGSMYDQHYLSPSPWGDGEKVTLMEHAVWLLAGNLLAPDSRLVRPGDRVFLHGFYSKVAPLEGLVSALPRDQLNAARVRAMVEQLRGKQKNFLDNKETKTDFAQVVQSMNEQYRRLMGQESGQGYNKLVFVILTDGGHDREATLGKFKDGIKATGELMRDRLASGQVEVHLFGVVAGPNGGAWRSQAKEHEVTADFVAYMRAKCAVLDLADLAQVNRQINSLAKRIEVVDLTQASYEPAPPAPAGTAQPAATGQLRLNLALENLSCHQMVLEKVRCEVYGMPDDKGNSSLLATLEQPHDKVMPGHDQRHPREIVPVAYGHNLAPGRYRLLVSTASRDLGWGHRPAVEKELVVSAPPAPPPPPPTAQPTTTKPPEIKTDPYRLYKIIGILALVAMLAIGLWLAFRPKKRRDAKK